MNDNKDKLLKIISNETKDSIMDISVVTPSIYASLFTKFASDYNQVIEDENELSKKLLKEECSTLTKLQDKTSKGVAQLNNNTDKAINAIKNNDKSLLEEVLAETNKLKQEFLKLKEAVYKDELTHALNRKWLHDNLLDDENDNFILDGTLAIIDLNYFKNINDTYGHIVGDKVLVVISNQLQKLKENVIRYGGDEFIVIFKDNVDSEIARKKLEKLRENIISKKLKTGKDSFKVSFSLGTHEFKKGDNLASVIEQADKKMYVDKKEIKKRVTGI